MKTCTKCQISKPVSEFNKDKHSKTGYTFRCRSCIHERKNKFIATEKKICNVCNVEKLTTEFHKDKKSLYGVRSSCKDCNYKKIVEYRTKNPEKRKETIKKYNNSERGKVNNLRYHTSHKAKINRKVYAAKNRKRINEWYKKRKLLPKNHLDCIMSGAINTSLKLVGTTKQKRSWEVIVGYSVDDLKTHLEKTLTSLGLTWEGLGTVWEIDHKRPKSWYTYSSFDSPQFKHCWSLENLQPLLKSLNRKKKNKWSDHPDDIAVGIKTKEEFAIYLQKMQEKSNYNPNFLVFFSLENN